MRSNKIFIHDITWYTFGTILPMLIMAIRPAIFTRHYSPEDYGYYTLVSITYSYIGIFLFSFVSTSIWRYYEEYKNKTLKYFYSNQFFLFIIFSILVLFSGIIWISVQENLLLRLLIIFSTLQVITSEIINNYLIIIRINNKTKNYNLIQITRSILNFLCLLVLAFFLHLPIYSFVLSIFIINIFFLFYISYIKLKILNQISVNLFSGKHIKRFLEYGFIGMITNLTLFILTASDRYFISHFFNIEKVGIYNQIYYIGTISIGAIITAYINTINPSFIKRLTYKPSSIFFVEKRYLTQMIYIISPIAVYISIYAWEFCSILLGKPFREGYFLIPYISISSFLYGMVTIVEMKNKFQRNYKKILISTGIAAIFNIVLNILFIEKIGYTWAAISTFLSYVLLYVLYYFRYFSIKNVILFFNNFKLVLFIYSVQLLIHYFSYNQLQLKGNWTYFTFEMLLFTLSYYFLILKSKLMKFSY